MPIAWNSKKLVVTGATGFVGSNLTRRLIAEGASVVAAARGDTVGSVFPGLETTSLDLNSPELFDVKHLQDVDCFVHLAAQVHLMRPTQHELASFELYNTVATKRLAEIAAHNGVSRFVFLSTAKVCGESTDEVPFSIVDTPNPKDPYSRSKYMAEEALWRIAQETGMEIVIIRPPLVYGPNVRGNFLSIMKWLHRGFPLPFGKVNNKRSLVAIDNLVDAIMLSIHDNAAANQTFFVSDNKDISTDDLVRRISTAMNVTPRLWPVPIAVLRAASAMVGRPGAADRLVESLQLDISAIQNQLGWSPVIDVDAAIETTVKDFLTRRSP